MPTAKYEEDNFIINNSSKSYSRDIALLVEMFTLYTADIGFFLQGSNFPIMGGLKLYKKSSIHMLTVIWTSSNHHILVSKSAWKLCHTPEKSGLPTNADMYINVHNTGMISMTSKNTVFCFFQVLRMNSVSWSCILLQFSPEMISHCVNSVLLENWVCLDFVK